jgi:copper transport protein
MAIPLAVSAAMTGHAAASGTPMLTISADALHVLAAGGWAGGVYFVLVGILTAPAPADMLRVVRAFNGLALTCAALVVATGVFAAYMQVGTIEALRTSTYGVQLVVKLIFVFSMLAAGAYNWRRGAPALASGDARAIRRGVAIEVFFALSVILATARLVVMEPPAMEP